MKVKRSRWFKCSIFLLAVLFAAVWQPNGAQAAAGDVLFGVAEAGPNSNIDPSTVTDQNFTTLFTNNGDTDSSLTMSGDTSAMIGAIWTGGTTGDWRQIRIVIDSNGDGTFAPMDHSDASHPWNPPDNSTTSWTYTYPSDYPGSEAGTTITVTYDTTSGFTDFPFDTFQWWYYESGYDRMDCWWMEKGQLMNMWWDGRDNQWNVLPNAAYKVQVWVDEDDDGTFEADEANDTAVITIQTASITGTVHDSAGAAISGAEVEVNSPNGWGNARTATDGTFTVSGLQAGGSYHVRIQADGKVTWETNWEDSVEIAEGETSAAVDGIPTTDAVDPITMSDAISISGNLKLDLNSNSAYGEDADRFVPYTNQWGWPESTLRVWVDAHNTRGPGWGNAEAEFEYPQSSIVYDAYGQIDSYTANLGDHTTTFAINIPIPEETVTYNLNFHLEGYVASYDSDDDGVLENVSSIEVEVTSTGAVISNPIVLTKAAIVNGSVTLPVAVEEWMHIDVQAVSTTDSDVRYWGWGDVNPNMGYECSDSTFTDQTTCEANSSNWFETWLQTPVATTSGSFRIDGISAGTYDIQIRVQNHEGYTIEGVVIGSADVTLDPVTISRGNTISGTITIQGDTTEFQQCEWCGGQGGNNSINFSLDAWGASGGSWTSLSATKADEATNLATPITYTLGGLGDGTYDIFCWFGEGFELVDEDGEKPRVTLSDTTSDVTENLFLKPFQGSITGTITEPADVTLASGAVVMVEVKRPWDWMPPNPILATDNGDGTWSYTVSGLGTSDYVVKVGVYTGYYDNTGNLLTDFSTFDDGYLVPDTDVGIVIERAFVKNISTPTTLNIPLERGYSITGAITLDDNDLPWHDVGDGAGGNPDGIKNDETGYEEAITLAGDLAGLPVMAMGFDMMMMGGQDPRVGFIQTPSAGSCTYTISGLAPGVYTIMPPFASTRIENLTPGTASAYNHGGMGDMQETHHWTITPVTVVVSDEDVTTGADFVLGNGYTLSGRLTIPEALSFDENNMTSGDWNDWIGHLEVATASHQFMGHAQMLHESDFNGSNTYEFSFDHVANGDYMVQFWTDRYVPGTAEITINNANASANITIETGANIVGKLIDAETGEAVTADDGIMVVCEAYPFVEGSWRETRDDDYAKSYIESDSDLQSMAGGSGSSSGQVNTTPGKFHLNALPTGCTYMVRVQAEWGEKQSGAKNYIGVVKAGIVVPEGATGDIDIGTISLQEGTTIKGRILDADGNAVSGIEVFGFPSDAHDGSSEAEGLSDIDGYYTLYGVDPNIAYYDLIAAEQPDMFDNWGKTCDYGESRKYNVTPNTTDADFQLELASASISGTLTIPSSASFALPFSDEMEIPSTNILLQKKGVIYKDVMDGIEGMSVPASSDATTTTYEIDNLAPGTYSVMFMNYGLPTMKIDDVVVAEGSNTLDATWEDTYYTVSGACVLSTGGYPTSADISGVICININDQTLTFGRLTEEADGTYSAYAVPGLENGATYQLMFFVEGGDDEGAPEIFTVGTPFTVSADLADNDATISRITVPVLMNQAFPEEGTDNINIQIFSTAYLVDISSQVVTALDDDSVTVQLLIVQGSGTLSNPSLSADKRDISAVYTKDAADGDVIITVRVHYGDDATVLDKNITFNANASAANSDAVNAYMAGQVKLGNGDAAQIYIPAGMLTVDGGGKAIVTVEKSDEEPGAASGAAGLNQMSRSAAQRFGKFSRALTEALPSTATSAGKLYDFGVSAANTGSTATINTVTIQIEYDHTTVTDASALRVMHLKSNEDTWSVEATNLVVDEVNHTITVDVTSLSPFIAAVVESDDSSGGGGDTGGTTTTVTQSSSGSSSGCFISSAAHAGHSMLPVVIFMLSCCVVLLNSRRVLNRTY